MRRSFSLAMGFVLIVAMLGVQASVSVLAQSTPSATPGTGPAGPLGVKIADGFYVEQLGETQQVTETYNLYLLGITESYGTEFDVKASYPAAILHVDDGEFVVTAATSAEDVQVSAGVTTKEGVCKPDKSFSCKIAPGQPVTLRPGDTISMKQATFTIKAEPLSAIKSFQSGSSKMSGSVVQSSSSCTICPRPY